MDPSSRAVDNVPGLLRRDWLRVLALLASTGATPWALRALAAARSEEASALLATYEQLAQRLAASPLGMPVLVESTESAAQLNGVVYAVSRYPFGTVSTSLARPRAWCEALMLPFNTRGCRVGRQGAAPALALTIVRKNDADDSTGHTLNLEWDTRSGPADVLEVRLTSDEGPFGTAGYAIVLRAVALPQEQTFMHFTFAFRFGTAARLATQAYLATAGRNKVGFSAVGGPGSERLVGGMRGVVERNVMRYFLAIESWLQAAQLAPERQLEARLASWFDATERFPRQLHEMDKAEYLDIKRRAWRNQQQARAFGG